MRGSSSRARSCADSDTGAIPSRIKNDAEKHRTHESHGVCCSWGSLRMLPGFSPPYIRVYIFCHHHGLAYEVREKETQLDSAWAEKVESV